MQYSKFLRGILTGPPRFGGSPAPLEALRHRLKQILTEIFDFLNADAEAD